MSFVSLSRHGSGSVGAAPPLGVGALQPGDPLIQDGRRVYYQMSWQYNNDTGNWDPLDNNLCPAEVAAGFTDDRSMGAIAECGQGLPGAPKSKYTPYFAFQRVWIAVLPKKGLTANWVPYEDNSNFGYYKKHYTK